MDREIMIVNQKEVIKRIMRGKKDLKAYKGSKIMR